MLNENAKKWVEALRSGRFQQTKNRLHAEGEGYCCLGVACEVAMENGVELETKVVDGTVYRNGREQKVRVKHYAGNSAILPQEVVKWLGLSGAFGDYKDNGISLSLVTLNDHDGKTFAEIADVIESEPEGLFQVGK